MKKNILTGLLLLVSLGMVLELQAGKNRNRRKNAADSTEQVGAVVEEEGSDKQSTHDDGDESHSESNPDGENGDGSGVDRETTDVTAEFGQTDGQPPIAPNMITFLLVGATKNLANSVSGLGEDDSNKLQEAAQQLQSLVAGPVDGKEEHEKVVENGSTAKMTIDDIIVAKLNEVLESLGDIQKKIGITPETSAVRRCLDALAFSSLKAKLPQVSMGTWSQTFKYAAAMGFGSVATLLSLNIAIGDGSFIPSLIQLMNEAACHYANVGC